MSAVTHRFARIQPATFASLGGVVHHRRVPHRLLAGSQQVVRFDQFGSSVSEVNNPALRP
jgi:hypothetical protein